MAQKMYSRQEVEALDVDGVVKFAPEQGFDDDDVAVLRKEKIDGSVLEDMTVDDFTKVGMRLGPAKKLMKVLDKVFGRAAKSPEEAKTGDQVIESTTGAFMKHLHKRHIPFFGKGDILVNYNWSLGHGAFGEVFLGSMYETTDVVVKVNKRSGQDIPAKNKETMQEALRMFSCIGHPNIATLLGVTEERGLYALVLKEYEISLEAYMKKEDNKWDSNSDALLRIMHDVCAGVHSLHRLGLVHMDLASRNVLLDRSQQAVVSDFGQVRKIDEMTDRPVPEAITSDPDEQKKDGSYLSTPQTDIKQLGLMFLAMITDQPVDKKTLFSTLSMPKSCDAELWNLLGRCIDKREARPKECTELLRTLHKLSCKVRHVGNDSGSGTVSGVT